MRKLIVAVVLFGATPAWALDGFQDRRGLFAGIGLGGGFVGSTAEGVDDEIGQRVALRVGGGVQEDLTLDLSFDFLSVPGSDAHTFSFWGGGSYFFMQPVFVRAAVGFASLTMESDSVDDISEAGLGLFIGAGFEMFVNSDLAVGFTLGYERQQFKDPYSLNIVSGLIGINWY